MPVFSKMRQVASAGNASSSPRLPVLPSLEDFRAIKRRQLYLTDPVLWAEEKLGVKLWSRQREILYSIVNNRYTAVPSCYESGKSFIAAIAVCWWIDVHPIGSARVITTATTGDQVKAILWHEITRAHARGKLAGRLNQTEWWMTITAADGSSHEEMVAFGRKPAEHNPTAMQGIHERYILVVGDEAAGLPKSLLEAMKGLLGNEAARLLLIGNPEDPLSEFAKACAPASGYNVIRISAFDTPNFTGEDVSDDARHGLVSRIWVSERERDWGVESPMYKAKVLGEFPENSDESLIPLSWIRAAQQRWNDLYDSSEAATVAELVDNVAITATDNELGIDVGGGNNKNVICHRLGLRAKIILENNNPDTMATLEFAIAKLRETGAVRAKIDAIGIGHGASDRAGQLATDETVIREQPEVAQLASKITGVEVGRAAIDNEHFVNLRAEGYWYLRELFREGIDNATGLPTIDGIAIDPADELLAAQLSSIRWKYSAGRIQIESKRDMKTIRKLPSPDRADAMMLAFLKLKIVNVPVYDVTW